MIAHGKPRLHIIGAKGNIGSLLLKEAQSTFEVCAYSSQINTVSGNRDESTETPFFSLADAEKNIQLNEPVIFLSHSQKTEDVHNLRKLLESLKTRRPHLIFVSTMAIYSTYKSDYAEIKEELECVAKSFDSYSIVRLGFVYGKSLGGLSATFLKLASKKILILPNKKVKTCFVSQSSANKYLLEQADQQPTRRVTDFYHAPFNLFRMLDLFGFRGKAIGLPSLSYPFLLNFFNLMRPLTPQAVQSFLSISFLKTDNFTDHENKPYLRRFIMSDYVRLFGAKDLWQLRKYVREIEGRNTLSSYLDLSSSSGFIYLYRLKELMEVEQDQQEQGDVYH